MKKIIARERFLNLIVYPDNLDSCWSWKGSKDKRGYCYFWYKNKMGKAHRFSYEFYKGTIPEGMQVLHKCDNPSCVNPSHLWLGTNNDNVQDKVKKNRQYHPAGIKNPKCKLTEKEVKEIIYLRKFCNIPYKILMKKFKIGSTAVRDICSNRSWKSLEKDCRK